MPESRIEVADYGEFNPREWLRREVLWASVMAPYSIQMDSWLDGTRQALHDGNLSRKEFFDVEGDPELQALSFFNHGKTIAGPLTSAALFRASMYQPSGLVNMLEVQAKSIDKVFERLDIEPTSIEVSVQTNDPFKRCSRYARLAASGETGSFMREHNLLRAASAMTILATAETREWLENSRQNEAISLPNLIIQNGGHPRSAGQRIEMLQPIFRQIISSEGYQALAA